MRKTKDADWLRLMGLDHDPSVSRENDERSAVRDLRVLVLVVIGLIPLCWPALAPLASKPAVRRDIARQLLCPGSDDLLSSQSIYWTGSETVPSSDSGPGHHCLAGENLTASISPLFFHRLPINQAGREALMTIPGIGSRLASAIIDQRERAGGIKDRASLRKIDGVGEKKAEVIGQYVSFSL